MKWVYTAVLAWLVHEVMPGNEMYMNCNLLQLKIPSVVQNCLELLF